MTREWRIVYFPKGHVPPDDGCTFGCGVEGIVGSAGSLAAEWSVRPLGEVVAGTYAGALDGLAQLLAGGFRPDAAVVFFAKALGMEDFLRQAARLLPGVTWGGGGAAFRPETGTGELLPAAQDVALLLICDDRYRFTNVWENVHEDLRRCVAFRAGGLRTILAIRQGGRDHPALRWYEAERDALGFPPDSYENLALASPEGWNLHASPEGEFALRTGADLPGGGELSVRTVQNATAQDRVAAFLLQQNALVFGCAGLKALLKDDVKPGPGTLAGFLHGEVLTVDRSPRFANLMMSGLVAPKRV